MMANRWFIVVSEALKQEVPRLSVGEVRVVSRLEDCPEGLTPWDLSERLETVLVDLESETVSGTFDIVVWRAGKRVRRLQFSAESGGWLIRKGKVLPGEKGADVRKLLARATFSTEAADDLVSALLGRDPDGEVELWPRKKQEVFVPEPPTPAEELLRAVRSRKWPLVKKWGRNRAARAELEDAFTSEYALDRDALVLLAGLDVLGPRSRDVQAHVDELFQNALREDDLKTVRARLACRPDFSAGLHVARSASAIKALMGAGANANARNADGLTPLMTQVSRPWPATPEVVRALLTHGASPDLKAKGRTALQILETAVAEGGSAFASWTKDVPRLLSAPPR